MRIHPEQRVKDYTARGWWNSDTIDGLLRARVDAAPGRLAIVDPVNKPALTGSQPLRWTWAELDARVDALAAQLLDAGIGAGDVVGVQLPNVVELAVAFLAIVRVGAIVSPFPVQYREFELVQLGPLARIKVFVTAARIADRADAAAVVALKARIPTLETIMAWGDDLPAGCVRLDHEAASDGQVRRVRDHVAAHPADPNDCVTICWTSGTEATPKGVPRAHCDWLAISWATLEAPEMTADDVLLNPFPMVNMAGISGLFLPWLRAGCVFVQHHPFDLPTFLRQVGEERVTYTVAPPALLTMLLMREDLLAAADISSLRVIGSGSAPLSPAMVRGWQERHRIGIINFFGSNEGIALLSAPVDMPDPEDRARFFPRFGAPGAHWATRVSEWVSTRLVDSISGAEITEPGRPGELHISGPMVFAGYLAGSATSEPFDADGYLCTGDVFEIAGEQQQYLRYVDRAKDLVIRGGMNIAPAEVEGLLAGHPQVADVAVVGFPDDVLGERCCAVVVPRPGETVTLQGLCDFLREKQIASYKLPERLELVDALPRNPVGKVLKRELRTRLLQPA